MSNFLQSEYKYIYKTDISINLAILNKAYAPLLSSKALAFYNFMYAELLIYNTVKFFTNHIGSIFKFLNITKKKEFDDIRNNLEALKLLNTYYEKSTNTYYFELLEPKKFSDLIENKKVESLLIETIGENELHKLKTQFASAFVPDNVKKISESFDSYYSNNNRVRETLEFNFDKLYKSISKTSSLAINIDDVKNEINEYYVNYDVSYENIEKAIYNSIVKKGNEFVVNKLLFLQEVSQFNNSSVKLDFFNKIKLNRNKQMFIEKSSIDSLSNIFFDYKNLKSEQYLSAILKSEISDEEIKIINELRSKYFLNDSLINIMIDFSIDKTHHKLNVKYLTKTARSFNLENIETVEQAYEYLMNPTSKRKRNQSSKSNNSNKDLVGKIESSEGFVSEDISCKDDYEPLVDIDI